MEFNLDDGPYSGLSTPLAEFPPTYDYDAARSVLWQLPEHKLLLGINGEGEPEIVDLRDDSPHMLMSAASGAGKSVTARVLATQALVKGYQVVILDVKRHSHRWAKNLPGVHYAASLPEIGDALVSIGIELHRRNKVVEEWPGDVESAPVGPRVLIVFEEMNATMDALADLDKQLSKGEYNSMQAFADIMFLGRAVGTHVLAFSQYADRKTIKTSLRENFGVRILVKHSWEAWAMLVPRASRSGGQPAAPRQRGRGYVVQAGVPRQTQLLIIEEEQCAQMVRDAYDARVAAGLVDTSWRARREVKRNGRKAIAAMRSQTGME